LCLAPAKVLRVLPENAETNGTFYEVIGSTSSATIYELL